MKHQMIVVLILSAFLFAACGQAGPAAGTAPAVSVGKTLEAPGGSYTLVSVTELKEMLTQKDFIFANVHIPYDGEIDKTDLFIPYNEIDKIMAKFPAKDAKIVLYCRSGGMSKQAALVLVNLGYTNVYDVDGGMIAWEAAGFPLLRKAQERVGP